MNRRVLLVSALAVAALGGIGASYVLNSKHVAESLDVGGPFKLVGTDGQEVTEAAVKGKYSLFFFGFTFCPDACPTALNTFTLVLEKLGPDADKIQPVFVSIDPERDTPEVLKQYLSSFDPRIMGLTGTPEAVAEAAKKFRVYYAKQGEGEFAPFFGVPALSMVLVSRLAQRSGCAVLFAFAERLPRGAGYRIHFRPAPDGIADSELPRAVAALNQGVEDCVRQAFTQYQWHYKRYQYHPDPAAPNPYWRGR